MKNVKRRGFLSGLSGSLTGLLTSTKLCQPETAEAVSMTYTGGINEIVENPNDVKLKVKLVYSALRHSEPWVGPCRPSAGESGDAEVASHRKNFKSWVEGYHENITPLAELMEPTFLRYIDADREFHLNEHEFGLLHADKDDVDLYIVNYGTASQFVATTIGKRFNKPVAMVTTGLASIDASAHLRARGYEGYAPMDFGELNKLCSLLLARKVFRQTRMLVVTNIPMPGVSEQSSVCDFDDLAKRFGIGTKIINYNTLSTEMESVMGSKEYDKKARELADLLIKKAQGTYLDEKYVFSNAQFYYTVKNLLDRFNCNAFTIECWEFCTSRYPQKWKIVPCLVHTLLKDEGYASACQGDISALLAMRLLQSVSRKSTFMGNAFMDMESGLMKIGHSVPGIKMNGYDVPDLPFTLRHFTDQGWGAKVMINFAENSERTATLVNTDPLAKKIMAAKGYVEKCIGFTDGDERGSTIGCSLQAHLKMDDPRKLIHVSADYGTHVAMCYGDYREDIREVSAMLGMEYEDAT